MKYKMNLIATNAKDHSECEIEVDVYCNIILVNRKFLRGIAKLDYMGITLDDILVTERRGELKIEYPKKRYKRKDGTEKSSSIVFPNVRELSSKFNYIIQQEYSRVDYKRSKNPALRILATAIESETDGNAVKTAA